MSDFRLLFVAFGCEPGRGSEPGVGWGFVEEASRRRPVWVVTHANQKEPLDQYLASKHEFHAIHPIYVRLPGLGWLWHTHLGINIYYYLWQFKAARVARKLHKQDPFDIVQHVSFSRYWMQTAGGFIGAPLIFGPVGGGEIWPPSMKSEQGLFERVRQCYWSAIRWVMERDPFFRKTLKRSRMVIAGCEYAREQFRRLGVEPIDVMSIVAPTPKLPPAGAGPKPGETFRFISIGRLPSWRGVHLGLRAFAQAFGPRSRHRDCNVEYVVIGEGADLNRLKRLAAELGIANRVRFEGNLSYAQCLEHLADAGALIHPTLRDSAGLAFESISLGVPVACTDVGTPPMLIDANSGVIIPTTEGADELINNFAATMLRWQSDHEEYARLRKGAVVRAQQISRARRGDRLEEIYAMLLGGGASDPANDGTTARKLPQAGETTPFSRKAVNS